MQKSVASVRLSDDTTHVTQDDHDIQDAHTATGAGTDLGTDATTTGTASTSTGTGNRHLKSESEKQGASGNVGKQDSRRDGSGNQIQAQDGKGMANGRGDSSGASNLEKNLEKKRQSEKAHAAKARKLKEYLLSQMEQKAQFDKAYYMIRNSADASTLGQSIQEKVGAVIGSKKVTQLFPLFQLLVLLEDIAEGIPDEC